MLSIEFQWDDESVNALSILDFIRLDQDKCPEHDGQLEDHRLKTVFIISKLLSGQNGREKTEPFHLNRKKKILTIPLDINVN